MRNPRQRRATVRPHAARLVSSAARLLLVAIVTGCTPARSPATPPAADPTRAPTHTAEAAPTSTPYVSPRDEPVQVPPHRIIGYFTSWGIYARDYHVKTIVSSGSAEKLSVINYAFAGPFD